MYEGSGFPEMQVLQVISKSNSNSFVNELCIPVFAKKSTKLLFNGLANGLCIFVNLAKS
jgi:hypothetical protein